MPSERVQRQIDALLNEAEEAMKKGDWATVRQRCDAVLRLDKGNEDARAYLEAAGADTSEALKQAPAAAAGAPSSPTLTPNPSPLSPSPSHPASFANGRYAVKRFLGEGGKKRVYLAHDTVLDRDVAFALIKTEGLDETAKTRITREAQAMGRLGDHPHLMPIHDLGREGDQPYMTLPLMGGGDVEGLIKKAPNHQLPLEKLLEIGVATAKGLAFAHGKGIVHRDIKPGNVWMTAEGVAKIGDFGLAVASDTATRLTTAGMMVGTVSYMPPEQAMGGEVTAKADLYSLGAMLYEMVTGRPPFVGDDAVAIIGQHLNTPPVAPTWHRPDCPPALEGLILRLLEKDPAKRPASAQDVLKGLEGIGKPTPNPLPGKEGASTSAPPSFSGKGDGGLGSPIYRRTFVGRESELKQLREAFDAAMAGQGGLMTVVGEPGIGKTALIDQLSTYAALRGGKALVGHCYEEGSLTLPYLAFVEAIRSYVLEREPDALRKELGTGAADVARIVSEVRDRVQVDLRPGGDAEDDRWRLLQAVGGFLRNAAGVQPLLVVLEDLHWADKGTLELMVHMARNLRGARLLIIGTYRDVEVDRSHPLSGAIAELRRIGSFTRVPLRGLTPDEVHRMVQAITGENTPYALAEAIHRQTEGNPLFIQEVLRYLVEEAAGSGSGSLNKSGLSGEALAGRIPEGLRDVVGKRLSRLSETCSRALTVASVIGRDFRLDVLQKVAGLSDEELAKSLEEARGTAVIEETRQGGIGGVSYRFTHAFFRQTLYEEIIAPRRIRLHQQVARALEEVHRRRLDEHAAELAEHFSYSSDPEDLARAVQYGEAAARRAMGVYAYGEAVRHLERCLQVQEVLDPDDKAKRCDLLLLLAEGLIPAGEADRASTSAAEEAFTLATTGGQQASVALARERAVKACHLGIDGLGRLTGYNRPEFLRWVQRLDRLALPGSQERAEADWAMSRWLMSQNRMGEAAQLGRAAYALARTLSDPGLVIATGRDALLTAQTPSLWRENVALARDLADRPWAGTSTRHAANMLNYVGRVLLSDGDRARAEKLWGELAALAERTQDPTAIGHAATAQVVIAVLEGRWKRIGEVVYQLRERREDIIQRVYAPAAERNAWGYALTQLGRFAEAAEMPDWGALGGRIWNASRLFQAGQVREAREVYEEGQRLFSGSLATGELPFVQLEGFLVAATLLQEREDCRVYAALLRPMEAAYGAVSISGGGVVFSPARLLGDASVCLGDHAQARKDYELAIGLTAKIRFRPDNALARLGLAEVLLDHYPAERAEAVKHLDAAIAEFRDMKMQPSVERALKRKEILKA